MTRKPTISYRDRTGTVVRNDFAREPVAYDVILEEAQHGDL